MPLTPSLPHSLTQLDERELDELREMKADVERKEKQQASIIEHQAKRLEELEKLYRDEQVRGGVGCVAWVRG